MYIDSDIRKFLIDPVLIGNLSIPIDELILDPNRQKIPLAANLRVSSDDDSFILVVRDSIGRDIQKFFTSSNKVTVEDTLSASGIVGEKFRVEFGKIWPPSSSTTRPHGEVRSSSAVLEPETIEIVPSSSDLMTHDKIQITLEKINPNRKPKAPDKTTEETPPNYEHIAIFADTKLNFKNSGVKWQETHSFWGKRSGSKNSTWDGEALGGTFSLKQADDHLELGFVHEIGNDDDETAARRFDALIQSVAYTHAIFPWPIFLQRRQNFRVMQQTLRVFRQEQGSMIPLRDRDGYESPNSPSNLIAAVAKLFFELPSEKTQKLKEAMWVFRGADSRNAPAPLQISMICSVIEGLRTDLYIEGQPPAAYSEIRAEATEWFQLLENTATNPANPAKLAMIKRLEAHFKRFSHADRRVEWNDVFSRLFPGREEWVIESFKLFNKYRHGPAHGNFGSITKGDPHSSIEARGRLAGLVNLMIAAMAEYDGPILESPFADRRINIVPKCSAD